VLPRYKPIWGATSTGTNTGRRHQILVYQTPYQAMMTTSRQGNLSKPDWVVDKPTLTHIPRGHTTAATFPIYKSSSYDVIPLQGSPKQRLLSILSHGGGGVHWG
jgi:hypothetical protein